MCKMFKVSRSGYYQWLNRPDSKQWSQNEIITATIRDIFKDSFGCYGSPRVRVKLLKNNSF